MESKDVVVSFVDSKYRIPAYAVDEIPRLKLLKRDYPDADTFRINEIDDGRFKKALKGTTIPLVQEEEFIPAPNEDKTSKLFHTFIIDAMTNQRVSTIGSGNSIIVAALCAIPITSNLILDPFVLADPIASTQHDTSIKKCVLCPLDWWEKVVGTVQHVSFLDEYDGLKQNIMGKYYGKKTDVLTNMYIAYSKEMFVITVTATIKTVK